MEEMIPHGRRILLSAAWMIFSLGFSVHADQASKDFCKKNYDTYKDRVTKNPADVEAWTEFRVCTAELKRWTEAAAVATEAIRVKPDISEPHLLLGITEMHTQQYAQAADEFDDAIRLKHDQVAAYHYLGMTHLFMNHPKEAALASERAVELEPDNPGHYSQLAYAYLLLDKRDECEIAAKKAIHLDPNNVAAYKVLGNLYEKEDRQADSDKAFEDAMHANARLAAVQPFVADKVVTNPTPVALPVPAATAAAVAASSGTEKPAENPEEELERNDLADPVAFCKSQWNKMRDFMLRGDLETGLLYFSDYADTRELYRQSFTRLGSKVHNIFVNFSPLYDCNVVFAVATCKTSVKGANGALTETTVRFERNTDRIWRIRSF
jgi:tetratricopeptide (TPR) repeat protein